MSRTKIKRGAQKTRARGVSVSPRQALESALATRRAQRRAEEEKQLLAAMGGNPEMDADDYARDLGWTRSKVARVVARISARGE